MSNLNEIIKRISNEARYADEPSDLCYGTVKSAVPLKIQIDQKLILTKEFLILSKNVMDYEVEITMDFETEKESGGTYEEKFAEHRHKVSGKKKVKIHNGLKSGDKVVLLKAQKGQSYFVMDKLMS